MAACFRYWLTLPCGITGITPQGFICAELGGLSLISSVAQQVRATLVSVRVVALLALYLALPVYRPRVLNNVLSFSIGAFGFCSISVHTVLHLRYSCTLCVALCSLLASPWFCDVVVMVCSLSGIDGTMTAFSGARCLWLADLRRGYIPSSQRGFGASEAVQSSPARCRLPCIYKYWYDIS